MITVCDVWKAFNRRDVLAGTSFYIRSGEVVGLLGANGAGKTTLYRILCGLMRPNTGAVYVNGTHPQSADRSLLSVFFGGSARVYDRLSARENIRYFARLHGIPHAEYMRRLDFFSGILGMESYLDRRTQNFSHGMKQKTALARMVIADPRILLLDEPTTGMDIPSVESVLAFVRECSAQGKTILYSSHSVSELERVSDRIIILHNGRITDTLLPGSTTKRPQSSIEELYSKRLRGENNQP